MAELPLFILYGSATGNAQQIAQDLASNCTKNPLPSPFTSIICCEANDFKKKCSKVWDTAPSNPTQKYGLILIASTTGNGDAPENSSRFIRYLKRKTTPGTKPFQHVKFAVLALGDTNYDQFCETGKIADKYLEVCAGERVKSLACADEGTGLEQVVDEWVENIVPIMVKACAGDGDGGNLDDTHEETKNAVKQEEKKEENATTTTPAPAATPSYYGSRPNVPAVKVGSRPNIPNVGSIPGAAAVAMTGSRPNVPAMVGSRPNVPAMVGSRPNVPAMVGSRPNVPAMVGSRPNVPAMVGSRPNVPAMVGSKPSIPSVTTNNDTKTNDSNSSSSKSPSPLCILYGSATGNSEHIAKDLATKYEAQISSSPSSSYFPSVICCELDKYKKQCQSHWEDESKITHTTQKHGVLFICSTTGNGDAPENASRFVRYLKRKSTVDTMPFRNVAYAVLGLGDTNYDQFCESAKIIDRKCSDLGGLRVKGLVCADEGTGALEATVDPWVESIVSELTKVCKGESNDEVKVKTEDTHSSVVDNTGKNEEEKVDTTTTPERSTVVTPPPTEPTLSTSSPGVSTIQKLLSLQSADQCSAIPIVPQRAMPLMGSSLSSYELVNEAEAADRRSSRGLSLAEMDRMTVSTTSSSGINYTLTDPFESQVMNARYLTNTSLEGAKLASEALKLKGNDGSATEEDKVVNAMDHFRNAFPLHKEESTDGKELSEKQYIQNEKRVIEMTLALPDDFTLEYQPGDSVGLVVSNTTQATSFVLDMLQKKHGIEPSQKISVDSKQPTTVELAVRDRIDLCSPLKNKRILAFLSTIASDKEDEAVLRLLASREKIGEEMFTKYIDEQCRNFFDILQEFPSCQCITLEGLLSVLPAIAPRYYSVCSSPLNKNTTGALSLNVTFSVVDYMTPTTHPGLGGRRIAGLATRYLEAICAPFLCHGQELDISSSSYLSPPVRIFPKPTAEFHLPPTLSKPLILIGPGTGIAPFMGFLSHRQHQIEAMDVTEAAKVASEGTWRGGYEIDENDLSISKRDASGLVIGADYQKSQTVGDVDVYFGCRYSDHDWLFKDEMTTFEKENVIANLNVAFSREGGGSKRVYVQDKMRNNKERLTHMIVNDEAVVYICGDGNAMAKDVQSAMVEILAEEKFGSSNDKSAAEAKAKDYLNQMKSSQRFVMDIWS